MNTAWLSLTVTLSMTWGAVPQVEVAPAVIIADVRQYPFGPSVCVEPATVSYGEEGFSGSSTVSVTTSKE